MELLTKISLGAIFCSIVWVGYDAHKIRSEKKPDGWKPPLWVTGCVFLWIFVFPAYLLSRRKYSSWNFGSIIGALFFVLVLSSLLISIFTALILKGNDLPVNTDKGNAAGYSLDICGDEQLTQITNEKIASALNQLAAGKCSEDSFVILNRTPDSYMQTLFDTASGKFTLEYQDGDLSKHFAARSSDLSLDEITRVFTEYLNGSDTWKTALSWEKINVQDSSDVNGEGSLEEFEVGDTLQAGSVELQITSTSLEKSVGDSFIKASSAEGGVYVVVNWTYKNISGKPLSAFKQPSINLVDPNGTVYNKDVNATSSYAMSEKVDEKFLSDLNPDIKVKAAAVFEVSEAKFNDSWKIKIDDTLISFKKNNASQVSTNDQPKSAAGWSDELKQGVLEGCMGSANNQVVHAICSCMVDEASAELTESQVLNFKNDLAVQEKINSITGRCKVSVMANAN